MTLADELRAEIARLLQRARVPVAERARMLSLMDRGVSEAERVVRLTQARDALAARVRDGKPLALAAPYRRPASRR